MSSLLVASFDGFIAMFYLQNTFFSSLFHTTITIEKKTWRFS